MAKTQKYSEDQLLEAVIKYSEIEKKKIKATELAEWSRRNIEGLEEVRDYHFTRSIRERDANTGKIIDRPKLCTLKINEINKARDITKSVDTNLLLRATNMDTFFQQSDSAQRKIVVETRKIFDEIIHRNILLARENEDVINKVLKETNAEIVPINIEGIEDIPKLPTKIKGALCVCPNKYYEGFFVAKLKKLK